MKLARVALGSMLFLTLFASSSMAQVQRTFASAVGTDSNPCSRSAPCRTLAQAISQTNAGGEVVVLDSAGYGPVTITKSISITAAPGSYAGISVFSGDGIDINVSVSDVVNLRGLTVNNQGSNGSGIAVNTGGFVRVEGCVVRGFASSDTSTGILLDAGRLLVRDTTLTDCFNGVLTSPGSGTVHAIMDHITVDHCPVGINISASGGGTCLGAIRDSSVSGFSLGGMVTSATAGATALLDIERCLVMDGAVGVEAQSGGLSAISISNCVITHNSGAGFIVDSGATIFSRGNNTIGGNGAPDQGSLTLSAGQ